MCIFLQSRKHVIADLLFCEGDVCKRLQYNYAVEEEYFSNCCYGVNPREGQTVNWYKEKEGNWTLIQTDGRIAMNGIYLEFLSLALNDSGNYTCR